MATRRDCGRAAQEISKLLGTLGLHLNKGERSCSTRFEHLGCIIDTNLMRFFIIPRKIVRVQKMARSLIRKAREGRRWVSRVILRSFCGLCVSLSLPITYYRFYSRSLYDDIVADRGRDCGLYRVGITGTVSHASPFTKMVLKTRL
jgi:hypothetical protein